jgi:hypothetical protein
MAEGIVRLVLGQYASLKPGLTCKPLFRADAQGTVVFDSATLKTVMVDKNAAETLKLVDESDVPSISHRLAMISGMHPVMASYMALRYLSNFQRQGFISLPVEIKAPKPPPSEKRVVFSSPVIVSWEITKACNLNCSHCASQVSEGKELDTGEALDLRLFHSLDGCLFQRIFPPLFYLPGGFSQHTAIRILFYAHRQLRGKVQSRSRPMWSCWCSDRYHATQKDYGGINMSSRIVTASIFLMPEPYFHHFLYPWKSSLPTPR